MSITDTLLIDTLFVISIALLFLAGLAYYLIIVEVDESFEENDDAKFTSRDINSHNVIRKGDR